MHNVYKHGTNPVADVIESAFKRSRAPGRDAAGHEQ
jgi:hypothetical protein